LQNAWIARAGNLAKCSGREGRTHAIEIGMVENVKGLKAELHVNMFPDFGVFEE
jgi:hypothetical protein